MRLLDVRLRLRSPIAAGAALALVLSLAPATAQADTLVAPQVFVRLLNANNQAQALTDWQPLPATLTTLGPYDIGVALQATSATANRQAVEADLASEPPGPIPSDWSSRQPYSPACKLLAGNPGQIESTGSVLYYHGNGAYALNISAYTEAQYNAITGQTCSGGPNSAVTLNVAATTGASIVGTPLIPRTTREAHGFNGLQIMLDKSNLGNRFVCARDPVFHPGGPVTGTTTTNGSDTQGGSTQSAMVQVPETDAFTKPGLWACSAQALGGDDIGNLFGTPWATTPAVTVKGEYQRDQSRTSLRRLAHGAMRMTVPAVPLIAPYVPQGRLTLAISRASCASALSGKFRLHRVIQQRVRVNSKARAVFDFHSPTADAFYLGRLTFGGTSLILSGPDAPMYLEVSTPPNPSAPHAIRFVDPKSWSPCP